MKPNIPLHSPSHKPPCLKKQAGLSLVELMIGMVLGLIIIAAVFNIYSGTNRSRLFTEGLLAMQENGRYGLSVLQKSFRLAGYSPLRAPDQEPLSAFDLENSSDSSIVVQSRQPYDCNGVLTAPVGGIAINTYALNSDTQQLTCQGNAGNTVMPVVDGVEEFRVLYGIAGDAGARVPQRFVTYDATLQTENVVALRFAMLVNSGEPIRSRDISETFVVLDREVARSDRLAREVFSSTVLLRN
ncbi:MAG: PilW family protein [Granulosicoccus sp.]